MDLSSIESPTRYLAGRGHSINFHARVEEIGSSLAPDTPVEVWFQDESKRQADAV
jgi:hypothetical protein